MTPVILLEKLKAFISDKIGDYEFPVKTKEEEPQLRKLKIFKMGVPSKNTTAENAPYVLLQVYDGEDRREAKDKKEGLPDSTCFIRILAVMYTEDEEEGRLQALEVITSIRLELEKAGVIDEFELLMPLTYTVYTDNTYPYFIGEINTLWRLPPIKREIALW